MSNASTQAVSSISSIHEESYSSSLEAAGVITGLEQSMGQIYPSGPPVDLGSGIQADFSGGAGQCSYKWHEGKWTVITRFWGNVTAATRMAKSIVSYLHTHSLPTPDNIRLIHILQPGSSNSPKISQNTIVWQEGVTVHELRQIGDPIKALESKHIWDY